MKIIQVTSPLFIFALMSHLTFGNIPGMQWPYRVLTGAAIIPSVVWFGKVTLFDEEH